MYNITDNYNSINHDIQIIEVILYCSDRNKAIRSEYCFISVVMCNITDNYNSIIHDIQIIEVILYC